MAALAATRSARTSKFETLGAMIIDSVDSFRDDFYGRSLRQKVHSDESNENLHLITFFFCLSFFYDFS